MPARRSPASPRTIAETIPSIAASKRFLRMDISPTESCRRPRRSTDQLAEDLDVAWNGLHRIFGRFILQDDVARVARVTKDRHDPVEVGLFLRLAGAADLGFHLNVHRL